MTIGEGYAGIWEGFGAWVNSDDGGIEDNVGTGADGEVIEHAVHIFVLREQQSENSGERVSAGYQAHTCIMRNSPPVSSITAGFQWM